MEVVN